MKGDRMVDVKVPEDADVIVLQRITHRYMVPAISLMRAKGIAVVVDMDDDLTCIHPANPAFRALHPAINGNSDHSWQNTTLACEAATLVTVSTPALLEVYARKSPGRVLYNCVPQRLLDVPHNDSDVIGWAGSVHSHPTDLQVMGAAPAQLLREGHRFKVAGPISGVHAALGVSTKFEIASTGVVKLEEWPLAVSSLGVAVTPLADTKFNISKSWLKAAEAAACGVPVVASPRAEYTRLHKLGVGWLARTPSEWRTKLQVLASDADQRAELAQRGREVMRKWTIEGNAWLWWETWVDALQLQRENSTTNPLVRRVAP
jgi:glycosyltransferase involved in cell wall biosynthesis